MINRLLSRLPKITGVVAVVIATLWMIMVNSNTYKAEQRHWLHDTLIVIKPPALSWSTFITIQVKGYLYDTAYVQVRRTTNMKAKYWYTMQYAIPPGKVDGYIVDDFYSGEGELVFWPSKRNTKGDIFFEVKLPGPYPDGSNLLKGKGVAYVKRTVKE